MSSNKSLKLLILSLTIMSISITKISTQNLNTGDFGNQEGLQIYYTSTSSNYYFGSYSGSATSITGKLYLILKDDRATINKTGIWVGVGFGSTSMKNSDMVMCFYIPEKEFYCDDFYSNSENTPKTDASLGGKNNISSSSGKIEDISIDSYKTILTFTFTKDISNLDNIYDWSEFKTWQTNKKAHSASFGKMSGRIPLEHNFNTDRSYLIDGEGYKNSLSLNLNQVPVSSNVEPIKVEPSISAIEPTKTDPSTSVAKNSEILNSKGIFVSVLLMIFILF